MPSETFDNILAAAVDDIIEHGYDSQERVDMWTRRLREAAQGSMISPESMEDTLRRAFATRYAKMVDRGGLLNVNPGVARYTIEKVKPQLRSELDRRIMASANLIKLNRQQAIDKTLQRFQGWSTSIPKGGSSGETKREVRKDVKKALAQLPFEERRVLIDQGHKLVSALSEIVATDGGAIAGMWRSHWRQAGYNYREDHKERDGLVYLVRGSWAHAGGLVKKSKAGYYEDITAAGQEPFCRCYIVWLHNLRDLPADMLTEKGKLALRTAQGTAEVRSARTGRADDAEPQLTPKAEARYAPVWINRQTRCRRCTMFLPLCGANVGNACTAVSGDINANGHCELFNVSRRADAVPVIGDEAIRARIAKISNTLRGMANGAGEQVSEESSGL